MSKHREQSRWLWAAAVVALTAALTFLLSDLVFQTNDDNSIISAACGGVTGAPYAGNGFTSYLYGLVLSGLYRMYSGLPWHGLLLLSAQLLSCIALVRSLFFLCDEKGFSRLWGAVAFAALYSGVGLKFMTHLQFTATPGYCAAGLAALLLTLPREKRARRFACAVGFGLMAFALLLRWKGGLLALPVPLLAGLAAALPKKEDSNAPLWLCGAVLLFALLVGGADGLLYRAQEPGWEEQAAFDQASAVLLDYHNEEQAYALAASVTDWSPELISCIRNWNLFLDERFTTENLNALATAIENDLPKPGLYELVYKTASVLRRYPEFSLMALVFIAMGLWTLARCFKQKRFVRCLALLGLGGSLLLVIGYFYGWMNRFPDRVAFAYAWPVYAALLILFFLCLSPSGRDRTRPLALGVLCLGLAALLTAIPQWEELTIRPGGGRESRAALTEQADAYASAHPELVYVTDVTQSFYALSTLRPPVNLLEWGSALIRSPMYQRKLEVLGYPHGFTCRQLTDASVRLLFAESASLQRLLNCLNADYGPTEAVLEADEGAFRVYRLQTSEK